MCHRNLRQIKLRTDLNTKIPTQNADGNCSFSIAWFNDLNDELGDYTVFVKSMGQTVNVSQQNVTEFSDALFRIFPNAEFL